MLFSPSGQSWAARGSAPSTWCGPLLRACPPPRRLAKPWLVGRAAASSRHTPGRQTGGRYIDGRGEHTRGGGIGERGRGAHRTGPRRKEGCRERQGGVNTGVGREGEKYRGRATVKKQPPVPVEEQAYLAVNCCWHTEQTTRSQACALFLARKKKQHGHFKNARRAKQETPAGGPRRNTAGSPEKLCSLTRVTHNNNISNCHSYNTSHTRGKIPFNSSIYNTNNPAGTSFKGGTTTAILPFALYPPSLPGLQQTWRSA